jgi:hypothetical protein
MKGKGQLRTEFEGLIYLYNGAGSCCAFLAFRPLFCPDFGVYPRGWKISTGLTAPTYPDHWTRRHPPDQQRGAALPVPVSSAITLPTIHTSHHSQAWRLQACPMLIYPPPEIACTLLPSTPCQHLPSGHPFGRSLLVQCIPPRPSGRFSLLSTLPLKA